MVINRDIFTRSVFEVRPTIAGLALCCALVLCVVSTFAGQGQDAEEQWRQKNTAKAEELKRNNGDGTDLALRSELVKMREVDQGIRKRSIDAPQDKRDALEAEMKHTDVALTKRLKEIVAAKGWPTISLVGWEASHAAAIVLIHSPDTEFQKSLLPQLQKLVDEGKIGGTEIAYIVDKILVAEGKLQRFGTQTDEKDNRLVISPVEDPEHVDQRRERYLLPPMAVYKKSLADAYHMPVE
jgi:hypothetical protein